MNSARTTSSTPMTAPARPSVRPLSSSGASRSTRMSSSPRKAKTRPLTANSTHCHTDRPSSQPAAVNSREVVERSSSPATRTASTPEAPSSSASRYSANGAATVAVVSAEGSCSRRSARRASQPPARPISTPPATETSRPSPIWPAVGGANRPPAGEGARRPRPDGAGGPPPGDHRRERQLVDDQRRRVVELPLPLEDGHQPRRQVQSAGDGGGGHRIGWGDDRAEHRTDGPGQPEQVRDQGHRGGADQGEPHGQPGDLPGRRAQLLA